LARFNSPAILAGRVSGQNGRAICTNRRRWSKGITTGGGNLLLERRQAIKIKIPSLTQLAPILRVLAAASFAAWRFVSDLNRAVASRS
jgi:hypothetical protein